MKLIVGLGNPGKQYENTRHNAGFITIDAVAKALGVTFSSQKFKAHIAETFVKGEKILLMKPMTYMNLSGEAVGEAVHYYDIDPEDVFVISDDKDLGLGRIRIRPKGSSGGQNGINNIIQHLHTQEFPRLKVGIGRNPLIPTKDYVLGKIDKETAIEKATEAVLAYVNGKDVLDLMNTYNAKDV